MLDSIKAKEDSILTVIEQADMLAAVLHKVESGEEVLEKYLKAVLRDDMADEFSLRLKRQGMDFGVTLWVLCEARKKGSLDTKKATGADL